MNRVTFTFTSGRKVTTTEAQAKLLKRIGKGDYQTAALVAEPATSVQTVDAPAESVVEISPRTGRPKRQYTRRDMVAED